MTAWIGTPDGAIVRNRAAARAARSLVAAARPARTLLRPGRTAYDRRLAMAWTGGFAAATSMRIPCLHLRPRQVRTKVTHD